MALWYFCVCFILQLVLVAGQPVHYVLKGREAILTPSLTRIPDDILWKHNGDKVITFDSAQESVYGDYKGRVTLAWDTAELAISDVRYEDSGEYELDTLIRDRLHRTQFMLKVLDKVSKPVINCQINDGSSSNKTSGLRATLLCSSESNTPEALTYKWNLEGKYQLGQALTIPLGNEHDEIEYSCTVTNPLHAETNIYLAKDCHTVRTTEALNVIVPIIIALLILVAFGALFIIFRHQLKKMCCTKAENGDLEKQIKEAMRNTDEAERKPLMNLHRQETIPSQQRLPQTDDGIVRETPQKQEIRKDLEELQTSGLGTVKKNKEIFEKGGQTEVLLDTQTESLSESNLQSSAPDVSRVLGFGSGELEDKGQNDLGKKSNTEPQKDLSSINSDHNKTMPSDLQKPPADSELPGEESHIDHDEKATSQPATPSMMPNCGPDDLGSSGQKDLNGEPENNTKKTNEACDSSSNESDEEFQDAEDLLEPGEEKRKGLTHSKEKQDMGHSDNNTQNTDEAGDSSSKEESSNESSKNSDETAELPQPHLQSSVPAVVQCSQSKPSEDESNGQADSDGEPDMDHSGDNAQKTNATEEFSTALEDLPQTALQHNAPNTDQDSELGPREPERKEQEDTNEKSNRDSTLEEGLQTGQAKDDSNSSDNKEPVLTDQSDTAQNKEPTDQKQGEQTESLSASEQPGSVKKTKDTIKEGVQSEVVPDTETASPPESIPQGSAPHVDQVVCSGPGKVEGKDQKDSDEKTNTDSTEDNESQKGPSSINSDPEKTGEPDVTEDSHKTPAEVPGSLKETDLPPTHSLTHSLTGLLFE